MHEETDLLNCECNIWSSEYEVLKSTEDCNIGMGLNQVSQWHLAYGWSHLEYELDYIRACVSFEVSLMHISFGRGRDLAWSEWQRYQKSS